jgi:hypothetical protein
MNAFANRMSLLLVSAAVKKQAFLAGGVGARATTRSPFPPFWGSSPAGDAYDPNRRRRRHLSSSPKKSRDTKKSSKARRRPASSDDRRVMVQVDGNENTLLASLAPPSRLPPSNPPSKDPSLVGSAYVEGGKYLGKYIKHAFLSPTGRVSGHILLPGEGWIPKKKPGPQERRVPDSARDGSRPVVKRRPQVRDGLDDINDHWLQNPTVVSQPCHLLLPVKDTSTLRSTKSTNNNKYS